MPIFKKKPVVIEARQFLDNASSYDLLHWVNERHHATSEPFASWINGKMTIPTLEGEFTATSGDWIIRGVAGEFYPRKPDIFAATYEEVS